MADQVHSFYKKAAVLAVINSLTILIPFFFYDSIDQNVVRVVMMGFVFGLVISLLISAGYSWMRWIMLLISILSMFSFINILNDFIDNILSSLITTLTMLLDIFITVMLFKVPKTGQAV